MADSGMACRAGSHIRHKRRESVVWILEYRLLHLLLRETIDQRASCDYMLRLDGAPELQFGVCSSDATGARRPDTGGHGSSLCAQDPLAGSRQARHCQNAANLALPGFPRP